MPMSGTVRRTFKLHETTCLKTDSPLSYSPMRIVTAITGASGALYAQRFIQGLVAAGVETHLIVSPLGRRLLHDELGVETVDLAAIAGTESHDVTLYSYSDVGAKIASGSFLH